MRRGGMPLSRTQPSGSMAAGQTSHGKRTLRRSPSLTPSPFQTGPGTVLTATGPEKTRLLSVHPFRESALTLRRPATTASHPADKPSQSRHRGSFLPSTEKRLPPTLPLPAITRLKSFPYCFTFCHKHLTTDKAFLHIFSPSKGPRHTKSFEKKKVILQQ